MSEVTIFTIVALFLKPSSLVVQARVALVHYQVPSLQCTYCIRLGINIVF